MRCLIALILCALGVTAQAAGRLDPGVRQLIVGIAPGWNSNTGKILCLEQAGEEWKPALGPIPVLFGKNGLAWGRGILGQEEPGRHKMEKDARAPAGLFRIGKIYTYDKALPKGADYPFHTVTEADAWVDNPALPQYYNQFLQVDLKNPPPWFESQKMRHGDFAYRWLIEIRHNSDPPVPGMGSAIFFHIRRGVTRPTWGCTSMAENDLVSVIRWLKQESRPHYVLLPWREYSQKWQTWGLPSPQTVRGIAP